MHEHLRACICDIRALQTDMWTKGQTDRKKKKQKSETDAWTQINTQGNAGNTLFQLANQLFFNKFFRYYSMFTHSV